MKLSNIKGFGSFTEYVSHKLSEYEKEEKNFETLFKYMFSESDNVFAEISDGYKIKKITYGEMRRSILGSSVILSEKISELPMDSIVGLYMSNSVRWIEMFWAILAAGYRPLLMNGRLSHSILEDIISKYSVGAVISDGVTFSVKTVLADDVCSSGGEEPLTCSFGSEVIFMSSGTSDGIKLCAFSGENFYYQVRDSVNIVKTCPSIAKHYEGELKQLALLPFYHVFGFIAVYLWFGFFSRTFVFPKDLNPDTIRATVKKHKVTHIFAVPMVWEAIHKAVLSKVRAKGDESPNKLNKAIKTVNSSGAAGDFLAKRLLSEVRDGLFGDSICFLISGGSHINPDTLYFYNGIGYHLANGYGMTEIGITSVERSDNKKILNSGSIGAPFGNTEYSVNEAGILLVKSRSRASRIMQDGVEQITDYDSPFETKDLVRTEGERYFIGGRADDLIVDESGENLNPLIAERGLYVDGIDRLCIFADGENRPVLIVSLPGVFSAEKLQAIYDSLLERLNEEKLSGVIKKIVFTSDPLISEGEFKISRTRLAKRYADGSIRAFDPRNMSEHIESVLSGLEEKIRACFAESLGIDAEKVGVSDDFFTDLGGNSMDYYVLVGLMKTKIGIDVPQAEAGNLHTVNDFCLLVRKNID